MTAKASRGRMLSSLGMKVFRTGAAHIESILGLALTSVLIFGILVSFNTMSV